MLLVVLSIARSQHVEPIRQFPMIPANFSAVVSLPPKLAPLVGAFKPSQLRVVQSYLGGDFGINTVPIVEMTNYPFLQEKGSYTLYYHFGGKALLYDTVGKTCTKADFTNGQSQDLWWSLFTFSWLKTGAYLGAAGRDYVYRSSPIDDPENTSHPQLAIFGTLSTNDAGLQGNVSLVQYSTGVLGNYGYQFSIQNLTAAGNISIVVPSACSSAEVARNGKFDPFSMMEKVFRGRAREL